MEEGRKEGRKRTRSPDFSEGRKDDEGRKMKEWRKEGRREGSEPVPQILANDFLTDSFDRTYL
jgi:hypothetical protein